MKIQNSPPVVDRRARGRPRHWDDKTAQNTLKSLDRAMAIFEYLSQFQGKTLTALSSELGQSPATVYRVLITLEARGLVEFDTGEQLWHIGSRAFAVGSRFLRRTNLVETARPILRRLMEETGETANLGIERDGMVVFVSQVETPQTIRAFFPHGTQSPMHASGIGKALLAQMDKARLDRVLHGSRLEGFTEHTLTEESELVADLTETRARGYAFDGEEKNIGMRCIAAPVFDHYNEAVAGISVSGPTSRMNLEIVDHLSKAVRHAADNLTRSIGGNRSSFSG